MGDPITISIDSIGEIFPAHLPYANSDNLIDTTHTEIIHIAE